jgi:hypothetical protein
MYASFSATPDPSPYTVRPARISLEERNLAGVYGQERSDRMDFTSQDRIPDRELGEIVWRSIRGAASPMPPPVRSAFVRARGESGTDRDGD